MKKELIELGESIPIRLFLSGYNLTPSYRAIHNKFSVKYFINIILIDEEDRRYFKQQEITLWRKLPKSKDFHKNNHLLNSTSPFTPQTPHSTSPSTSSSPSDQSSNSKEQ